MKKKLFIVALALLTFNASAQSDSLELQKVRNIELRLQKFYVKNRTSQLLYIASAACIVAGAVSKDAEKQKTLTYIGAGIGLVGFIVYFDSYSALNFKPRRKIAHITDPWY